MFWFLLFFFSPASKCLLGTYCTLSTKDISVQNNKVAAPWAECCLSMLEVLGSMSASHTPGAWYMPIIPACWG